MLFSTVGTFLLFKTPWVFPALIILGGIATNFSNKNYSYKDNEVYKDKTLYNKKNVILSKYWNISGLAATDEEQEIIDKIDENQ